jgi:hypothetical protein
MARLVVAAKRHDVAILVVMHLRDMEDDKWISKREIRGNKVLTQSSRMTLIYQDSGIPQEIMTKYGMTPGEGIVLDCQKASYGTRSVQPLMPELEQGAFIEMKENGY